MGLLSIFIWGVLFYVPLIIVRKLKLFSRSPLDNVAGPPPKSFLKGHLELLFGRSAHEWRNQLYENYGGVVKLLNLFSAPQLFVFDPIALHTVLIKEHQVFEESPTHLGTNHILFGPGLLSVAGDQHRKQRKLLNPLFSPAHLRSTLPIMYTVSYRLRDSIAARITSSSGNEVDMLDWISRTALELIGQAGLGCSLDSLTGEKAGPYGQAMKALFPALLDLAIWRKLLPLFMKLGPPGTRRWIVERLPSRRVQKMRGLIDIMDAHAQRIVEDKKAAVSGDESKAEAFEEINPEGKDIMSTLVRANMEAAEEEALTDEEMIGQISTLIFTSTDTSANAMCRILNLLAEHPDVQTKLREEIVQARREKGDLGFDDLFNLPYLEAVCRETLRLHPPSHFVSKRACEDTVLPLRTSICGVDGREILSVPVPKGTNVTIGIAALNRDKALWGEDALEWKPERWLEPLPDSLVQARVPGVYSNMLTFLGGGRACIGFKFSQCEMKVVLSLLLESFSFSLTNKPITWNFASVFYPSVEGSAEASLPLKVTKIST